MTLQSFSLWSSLFVVAVTAMPAPGLLRVPKVYNALITSNQNLSPSRAFPVVQPVIHTTAIGYVPPFYYTQIAPQYVGPELGHVPAQPANGRGGEAPFSESQESPKEAQDDATAKAKGAEGEPGKDGAKKEDEQVPLSFYPNYHSLYYDPYFYPYNGFNYHLAPSTYHVDYLPHGSLAPLSPRDGYSEQHLLPDLDHEEEKRPKAEPKKETIPDVPPPPPLPSATPEES